jgi:hypothetical protein
MPIQRNPSVQLTTKPPPRRPRFQFTLQGLMVLTFVAAAAAAPGYYLLRGKAGLANARLVGMLMMLAGPLLLMTMLSVFLSAMRRR